MSLRAVVFKKPNAAMFVLRYHEKNSFSVICKSTLCVCVSIYFSYRHVTTCFKISKCVLSALTIYT